MHVHANQDNGLSVPVPSSSTTTREVVKKSEIGARLMHFQAKEKSMQCNQGGQVGSKAGKTAKGSKTKFNLAFVCRGMSQTTQIKSAWKR